MNKSILITGAYGGMGRATAKALANMGYRVFALDKTVAEEAENIIPIEADITDENSVKGAFGKISAYTDNLFAVIHFAGVYMLDSLVEMESEEFERIFKINLNGAFLINKTFLPLLTCDSKIIITTSELAPLDPLPFTGIYAITKSALDKYAYSLRMELQLKDINVSVLRAGAVDTGMLGASMSALDRFNEKTKLYTCNAKRFKDIVESVEAKSVPAQKIANKIIKMLGKSKPKFAYSINRNPLLLILNALPRRFQFFVIKRILKSKTDERSEKKDE